VKNQSAPTKMVYQPKSGNNQENSSGNPDSDLRKKKSQRSSNQKQKVLFDVDDNEDTLKHQKKDVK